MKGSVSHGRYDWRLGRALRELVNNLMVSQSIFGVCGCVRAQQHAHHVGSVTLSCALF